VRVGEWGLLKISCECIRAHACNIQSSASSMCCAKCLTQQISLHHSQRPLDGPHYSLLTPPSPSCRDECWTYMYKVDCAAAAAFHLMLHSAGGLHIFDHASRPAVDTVAGCSSQRNRSQHCNRVITEFALY